MNVIGMDLSLSGTGVCFVDFQERFLISLPLRLPPYHKDFKGVFGRILEIKEELRNFFGDFDPDLICVEEALPKGQWAAGGFGLVSTTLDWALNEFTSAIYLYNPTFLGHVHGKKKYKKSQSVALAYEIIGVEDLKLHLDHRMNHDEAESFLFAYAGSIQYGRTPKYFHEKFMVKKGAVLRLGGINIE